MNQTTPAKKSTSATKKPRLSRAEAESKMLLAAVRLLLKHPPGHVTVHMIAAEAGVHHDYIARYFTSREELLIQVTEIPVTDLIHRISQIPTALLDAKSKTAQGKLFLSDDSTRTAGYELAQLRHQLISYLLANGISPDRFTESQRNVLENTMTLFSNPELTERSKRNFALMSILMVQSIALMGDANGMTQEDKDDISSFILGMGAITPIAQKSLGWDKPRDLKPKKRK